MSSTTRMFAIAGLVLLAAALGGCGRKPDGQADKPTVRADASWPNVVLISVDTLRADHLGCYGYARKTSPRIDKLAAEGALFEQAISSTSWTLPAHCAMFTGLSDSVHGCVEMDRRLPDDRRTLATRLKAVGYTTAGFFAGPALHPVFGVGQGFDSYVDCTSFAELTNKVLAAGQSLDGGVIQGAATADITNPRVLAQVRGWLDQNQQRPFFLFIHLWDVHFDFIPPPPYDRMFDPDYTGTVTGQSFFIDPTINAQMPRRDLEHIVALYDGEIAWTDEHVGKILDELESRRLRDSTVVMLLADHGEEFFEHGRKGHRQTLYDEVLHIPMIVRFPGRIAAGQRLAGQVSMIDVLPTLMELAGLEAPKDVMGRSLAPLLSGKEAPGSRPDELAVSELFSVGRQLRSYRQSDGKLIRDEKTKSAVLFDLKADSGEQHPVADMQASLAQRLLAAEERGLVWLGDFRKQYGATQATPGLPEHTRKQLESLGYIGSDKEKP